MNTNPEKNLENLKGKIVGLNALDENKKLVFDFEKECSILGVKTTTLYGYLKPLYTLTKYFKEKPFIKATKEDVIGFFYYLRNNGYEFPTKTKKGSPKTRRKYKESTFELWKIIIKKFFKFLNGEKEYPDCVNWIKNRKNKNFKLPEEMLTEEEILKIVNICDNLRDRSLVMVLSESACRIGELLSLKIKDVTFDEYGSVIVVDGKTGQRRLRLVLSDPDLREWINHHPFKDNPGSPLWISIGRADYGEPLHYPGVYKHLKVLGKRAGIKKKIYPHLFRHSRITRLAEDFNEADLRIIAGWGRSSKMPEVYIHRAGADVEDKYLKLYGKVKKKEKKEDKLKPKECPRCKEINPPANKFCGKCSMALDLKTVVELEKKRMMTDEWMNKLVEKPEVREFLAQKLKELIKIKKVS